VKPKTVIEFEGSRASGLLTGWRSCNKLVLKGRFTDFLCVSEERSKARKGLGVLNDDGLMKLSAGVLIIKMEYELLMLCNCLGVLVVGLIVTYHFFGLEEEKPVKT